MMRKLGGALNTSIADVTYFLRVKKLPFPVVEFNVKFLNEFRVDEIQECVTNVAVILIYRVNYLVVDG
jgi:hypothetical protein